MFKEIYNTEYVYSNWTVVVKYFININEDNLSNTDIKPKKYAEVITHC